MGFFVLFWLFLIDLQALNVKPDNKTQSLRIVGSSTVYPFVSLIAEEASIKYNFPVPIVESIGTGGGFKLFCEDKRMQFDIVSASRPITNKEEARCKESGKDIKSILLGYDAIVLVENKNITSGKKIANLTLNDIFLAIANEIPLNDRLVKNPYIYWSDIRPDLPKRKILFYGPPVTSGTREMFVRLVINKTCGKFLKIYQNKYGNKALLACGLLRTDGAFVDVGENDNVIVKKLELLKDAIGILGFDYFEESNLLLSAIKIEGKYIDSNNKDVFSYPLLRPLYLYFDAKVTPDRSYALKSFLKETVSQDASGENGYLSKNHLILLPVNEQKERDKVINDFLGSI